MKKTQYLAGIVAVSMMLMGAGYAAWTQNVTVDQTIKTGELSFKTKAENLVKGDYAGMTQTTTDGKITVQSTDLYPGLQQSFDIKLTNNGTLAEKFQLTVDAAKVNDTVIQEFTYAIGENTFDLEGLNAYLAKNAVDPNNKIIINVKTTVPINLDNEFELKEAKTIYTINSSQFNQ